MVCLDTDLLVGLIRNDSAATKIISNLEQETLPMTTTSITAYELLKGAEISAKPKENVHLIKDILSNLHVLDLDATSSEKASKIYKELNSKGILIGEFDILIASICIANDETLISNDEHFGGIKELKWKKW
jgi:predicted nucleic acid-binding protein